MTETLKIENLHVSVEDKPILHGVNMQIARGETHALMGPNGSGKSTLGLAVMGHPGYQVTQGEIELAGEMIGELAPDERARRGLFMAFQRPMAIPGVKMADFLRHATTNVRNPERKEGEDLMPMKDQPYLSLFLLLQKFFSLYQMTEPEEIKIKSGRRI